ncbi:MAG: adenylyl-sulfate kinase [Deltaproteobacteria bacterium]|nr:adenylyl-sulfate kinase [Deltaproteobacteria bacterium]MBW2122952.1 adenylyl-sulfate kinase [Deltaproteobacteria bacterium]
MGKPKSDYVTWQDATVGKSDRERLIGQKGVTLWFTGLSCSGKSTLANEVQKRLFERGHLSYVLDGDNIRQGLNRDLGFSPDDRRENIRRIGEVAKLFREAGVITLVAFISPYRADRRAARGLARRGEFVEIFCCCDLETCERRDVKGLYRKARSGEIAEFTGVSAPYEEPEDPEIILHTDRERVEESAERVMCYLEEKGIIRKP